MTLAEELSAGRRPDIETLFREASARWEAERMRAQAAGRRIAGPLTMDLLRKHLDRFHGEYHRSHLLATPEEIMAYATGRLCNDIKTALPRELSLRDITVPAIAATAARRPVTPEKEFVRDVVSNWHTMARTAGLPDHLRYKDAEIKKKIYSRLRAAPTPKNAGGFLGNPMTPESVQGFRVPEWEKFLPPENPTTGDNHRRKEA